MPGHPQIFKAYSSPNSTFPQPIPDIEQLASTSTHTAVHVQHDNQLGYGPSSAVLLDSSSYRSHSQNSNLLTMSTNDLPKKRSSVNSDGGSGSFPRLASCVTPGDMSKVGGNEVAVSMDVLTSPAATEIWHETEGKTGDVEQHNSQNLDASFSNNPKKISSDAQSRSTDSLVLNILTNEQPKDSEGALLDVLGAPVLDIQSGSSEAPHDPPATPLNVMTTNDLEYHLRTA